VTVTVSEPPALEAHAYDLGPVAGSCGMTGVLVGSTGGTYTSVVFIAGGVGSNGVSCTSVKAGYVFAGDTVCCPSGGLTTGDGSACDFDSSPTCALYGNTGMPRCATASAQYGSGIHNVGVGEHTFTVTDVNDCTDTVTIIVPPIVPLTATAVVSTAIACNGGTGAVTVTASDGVPPYTYSGDSPDDGIYGGLSAGIYT
jgi:hypothetical protein